MYTMSCADTVQQRMLSAQYGIDHGGSFGPSNGPWKGVSTQEVLDNFKQSAGFDAVIARSRSFRNTTAETSVLPAESFLAIQPISQHQSRSDVFPIHATEVTPLGLQRRDGRIDPVANKESSRSWSQVSSGRKSSSCDEIFSETSPHSTCSLCPTSILQVPPSKAGSLCQSQIHDGPILESWNNEYHAQASLWQGEDYPEQTLENIDFPGLGSTWLDDLLKDQESSTFGTAPLAAGEQDYDSGLACMTDKANSDVGEVSSPSVRPFEVEGFAQSTEDYPFGLILDDWSSSESLNFAHHQQRSHGLLEAEGSFQPGQNARVDVGLQRDTHMNMQGPSHPGHLPQKSSLLCRSDVANRVVPRSWSARHKSQRVRMQSQARCTQRPGTKDLFLVKSKLAGMSYREIRDRGNFTEAESTLRGRFRTLTKDKESRVRKPEWEERDVSCDFMKSHG